MNPLLANSMVRNASDINNADSSSSFTFAQPAVPSKVHNRDLSTLALLTTLLSGVHGHIKGMLASTFAPAHAR